MADLICNIIKRFRYDSMRRVDTVDGRRYVNQDGLALPSVTTILDATKNKAQLQEWQQKIGNEEAERIRKEAAAVGTYMHAFIEGHVKNRPVSAAKTWVQLKGYRMGAALMEKYFPNLDEIWGNEVMVHYKDRYAGTTDLVGLYKGKPSIVDFKQSNKMKKREWLDDYFHQLAAYGGAHNWQHGTDIRQGVILMASQDGGLQEFLLVDREFDHFLHSWNQKVIQAALAPRVVAVTGSGNLEEIESRTADIPLQTAGPEEAAEVSEQQDSDPGTEQGQVVRAAGALVGVVGFRRVEPPEQGPAHPESSAPQPQ